VSGGPAATPRVVSVNVGAIREVEWRGTLVTTGIWKEPVTGRVTSAEAPGVLERGGGPAIAMTRQPFSLTSSLETA
jgi:hypothetical protein